jgi:hypothetical protein
MATPQTDEPKRLCEMPLVDLQSDPNQPQPSTSGLTKAGLSAILRADPCGRPTGDEKD